MGDVVAYNYSAFHSFLPTLFPLDGGDTPYPAISDVLYLSVYPCLIAGLILLIRRRGAGRDRAQPDRRRDDRDRHRDALVGVPDLPIRDRHHAVRPREVRLDGLPADGHADADRGGPSGGRQRPAVSLAEPHGRGDRGPVRHGLAVRVAAAARRIHPRQRVLGDRLDRVLRGVRRGSLAPEHEAALGSRDGRGGEGGDRTARAPGRRLAPGPPHAGDPDLARRAGERAGGPRRNDHAVPAGGDPHGRSGAPTAAVRRPRAGPPRSGRVPRDGHQPGRHPRVGDPGGPRPGRSQRLHPHVRGARRHGRTRRGRGRGRDRRRGGSQLPPERAAGVEAGAPARQRRLRGQDVREHAAGRALPAHRGRRHRDGRTALHPGGTPRPDGRRHPRRHAAHDRGLAARALFAGGPCPRERGAHRGPADAAEREEVRIARAELLGHRDGRRCGHVGAIREPVRSPRAGTRARGARGLTVHRSRAPRRQDARPVLPHGHGRRRGTPGADGIPSAVPRRDLHLRRDAPHQPAARPQRPWDRAQHA